MTSVAAGDHVIPLYTAECRKCKFCLSGKTNLCQAMRATQGKGLMPDGTSRFSYEGKPIFHYMGTSTFSEYTVLPEISLAKIPGRAAGKGLPARLRRHHRHRRGAQHREGEARRHRRGVRPRRHRPVGGDPGRGQGQGRRASSASTPTRRKFELAKQLGATDCVNPKDYDRPIQDVIVEMTDGGVDFQLRMHRQRRRHARGAGVLPQGLGRERHHRRRRRRPGNPTRPFQLVTGRVWRGSAFGGVKGRTQLPGMVEQAMRGEIQLDPFITHTLPLEQINEAFDLMHEGKSIRTVIHF